ncbi:MAG: peptidase M14 [Rhizobacter sp.]|nr:peptidase M14 [Rhizobacter sp.]
MRSAFLRATVCVGTAGLVACSTTTLPPAPSAPTPTAPPVAAPAPVPPLQPAPAPVAPPPASTLSDAVSARFQEPAVSYRTPAFQPGRMSFTTEQELQAWMQELALRAASVVRLVKLGASQRGVPLQALLFSREADVSPAALQQGGRPMVLLVGQQQGDDGVSAEALMVVSQELAQGRLQTLLDRVNVLVLPRANPDGALTGQRATANGIELDRDHLLLQTPEAQAQARLVREYQPVVVAYGQAYDIDPGYEQKFGAVQAQDALLQYATTPNLPPFITKAAEEWLREPLVASLRQQGLTSDWYHSLSSDPASRKLSMGSTRPDNARNVQGLKNAVSLMVAGRGAVAGPWRIKRRVYTQVSAMTSILMSSARRGADLLKLRQYVDAEVSAQACQGQAVVEAAPTLAEHTVTMLDATTGVDRQVTVNWDSALALGDLKSRPRPCGYWLDADQGEAVARLRLLGVRVEQVQAIGVVQGDGYLASTDPTAAPGAAGTAAAPSGTGVRTLSALLDVLPGSYYVPLSQPLANLVIAALEPDTTFSYRAGGLVTGLTKEARLTALPGVKMAVMP